ncbi:flagellar basal-body rod protein FlgB [Pandoraea sputorum]|uniref:Flagellar basal body rod protein FlgB n=2 Tax=Pandoraea sputorum TaxID=93222 RepID=A0A239SYH2_9BURK|nr:flagellar basal body rod protein FlgB [Pandoraea sputorum]SNU90520.1 Putative proximal rod protein [Pandoraea sputorum]VVE32562.1 flagellar basal-body rod protein FlgB [Pandoraea sputorum]VVE81488.1 flagellar basal-body rod protein FlgB [Pandoraea sputorum]VVE84582.1 flagellar basal-body rod protein FlgB [Pandoraea sputorum]
MDKLDAALRFSQQALAMRAYRQEVISSNIANADTPGYKSRDVDFNNALSQAVERGAQQQLATESSVSLSRTSSRHIAGRGVTTAPPMGGPELLYRVPYQQSVDGNTVELDAERVNFADNAVHYQTGLTVLSSQIKTMLAAITSQG